jgi:MoaA/NifB/PqqE/SkfB family radical SAM enzyme
MGYGAAEAYHCSTVGPMRASVKFRFLLHHLRRFSPIAFARKLYLTAITRRFPFFIMVEPSPNCNLACPYCWVTQVASGTMKNMTAEHFQLIVQDVQEFCGHMCLAFRGEPFVARDIDRMTRIAADAGIVTGLSTNGMLLDTEEKQEAVVRSGLAHMIVSFDGGTKATYEAHRVGGNFEKVLANIRGLLAIRRRLDSVTPLVDMQFIYTKQNRREVEQFRSLALDLGVDGAYLKSFGVEYADVDTRLQEGFVRDMIRNYVTEEEPTRYRIVNGELTIKPEARGHTICPSLNTPTICSNGDLIGCCKDARARYVMGNVFREPFRAVWQSEAATRHRTENMKPKALDICRWCCDTPDVQLI